MNLSKELFSAYVKKFEFKELFIDMGWNNDQVKQPVAVDSAMFVLESIAEKEGFKILHCHPDAAGLIPEYSLRKKIEHQVTKLFHEHLIIYTDAVKTEQIWQLVVRESGKPLKVTETSYRINQSPEKLYQRAGGLFIAIDEEEKFTIVDVKSRVAQNFQQNSEKVTKKFYDGFKKQHTVFLDFIKGIQAEGDREWYASLMLNRLMFCYFIQKKGFLDKNKNYLQDKLTACQGSQGPFYSFYRSFLLVLFHQGLGAPNHNAEVVVEIGQVPYLNGGLFDEHEIEKLNKGINVDDKAFESLFKFFDEWDWHLDTRMNASGKEINPDVIGYIFEKYINDRAEMGAYYTKEDITDYISKNCIIPFLFDETKRAYPSAFSPDSLVWQAVKESGDAYIYEAVKHGVPPPDEQGNTPQLFDDLPNNIQMGFVPELEQKIVDGTGPYLCDLRKQWNTPAPPAIALPTEIYREVIERRKRCAELRKKIATGQLTAINDFITCNLSIRQFAQDLLENIDDPNFIRHFYKALCKITILDPTCGSGAFLFAALNILEPLYEVCLMRMRAFVEDEDRKNAAEKTTFGHKYKFFRETLTTVKNDRHPNQAYFIYKSIILNNLYGVDIMNEAVEIAKLRLFLKLVATVDVDYRKPNLGLEPLPDVDFNIRAGNTLIGFANEAQLKDAFFGSFDFDNDQGKIEERCDIAARTFLRYKEIQLQGNQNIEDFKVAKADLNDRLKQLRSELDQLLHKRHYAKIKYSDWLNRYKPFHWFAEYYEIIHCQGGFDVIIGNPPYVSMSKVPYSLKYSDYICSDLYGYVIKRSLSLLHKKSRHGFIVMHNLAFSNNFKDVRSLLKKEAYSSWFSFFARIPSGLFSGDVRVRNCIYLVDKTEKQKSVSYTTRIHRWFSDSRIGLIDKMHYTGFVFNNVIPMFNSQVLEKFYREMKGDFVQSYTGRHSSNILYYKQSAYNWIAVALKPAPCYDNNGVEIAQSKVKPINILNAELSKSLLLFLNGKLFFSFWLTYGDEFDVTKDDLLSIKIPLDKISDDDKRKLIGLSDSFSEKLDDTIQYKLNAGKQVGTYNTSKLWGITDISDALFLKYMCENQREVQCAIQNHVYATVLTQDDTEDVE
jgi:hypothetical protein